MKYPVLLSLALAPLCFADPIPSRRVPPAGTWESAGVPGGIPAKIAARTQGGSTITAAGDLSDQKTEIQTAFDALSENEYVLLGPGVFYADSGISLGWTKYNRSIRGSVNVDGSPATTIKFRGGYQGFQIGTSWNISTITTGVAASFTKGQTTLEVADSSGLYVGRPITIAVEGSPSDMAIFSLFGFTHQRQQVTRIVSKPDSTHITIETPGLIDDYSYATSININAEPNGFYSYGQSVENIIADATSHSSYGASLTWNGFQFDNSYASWFYNCKSLRAGNYGFNAAGQSYKCEMRRVWAQGEDNGSSTSGILVGNSSQILVTDSVVCDQPFSIMFFGPTSGCVVSHCYITPGDAAFNPPTFTGYRFATLNVNHAPITQFALIEGNVGLSVQNDGYYGPSVVNTYHRNWFMGQPVGSTMAGYTTALNRTSYNETLVGNVLGRTGIDGGAYSTGNPNIGNGNSNGAASRFGALSTLTTRTSATVGTITAPSGHGVTTGATIDVLWVETIGTDQQAVYARRGVTVGTVSGTSIPFSGGGGRDLPSAAAPVYVPTSNAAIVDYPYDWNSVTNGIRQWTGELTTRTSDTAGVLTLDPGQSSDFSASLALAFTSYPNQRNLSYAPTYGTLGFITIPNVTGDAVTFNTYSAYGVLPAVNTLVKIIPGQTGFQEQDVDVLMKLHARDNYLGLVSGSGIPSYEVSGETPVNSLYLSSTPQEFTDAGLSWPPINAATWSGASETSDQKIPAAKAYTNGWWGASSGGGGGSGATITTGSLSIGGTLSIGN